MEQIITIAAIKGGTGKTATCAALAQAAARDGQSVLAIDLDPQATLSIWLDADLSRPGSYQLLTGTPAEQTLQAVGDNLTVICGHSDLMAIKTTPGSAQRLKTAIKPLARQFDFAIIDTGPAMGELQNNALFASTGTIIPLCATGSSLQGFYQTMDIVQHIQESNPDLLPLGVIITQYDSRPNLSRLMRDAIKEKAEAAGVPYLGEIHRGIAIQEAEAMQQNLFEYAPGSRPAKDYQALYKKIMEGRK